MLRFQLPHAALALFYGVDRSTITRAVQEIRPLLAARGFAVPGEPGLRLRTLADVFAYAASQGVHLRIDGTEVQVRRPGPACPGRRAFVSGKKKQNTIKPTAIGDGRGRLLWLGAIRPGRMHDATALRTEGIEDLLRAYPQVTADVDSGYQGLARDFPGQITAPPQKLGKDATPGQVTEREAAGNSSPPGGSASSTPSPNPSNGGPCSATPDAANTSKTQPSPSAGWYPTAARTGKDHSQTIQATTPRPQSRTTP